MAISLSIEFKDILRAYVIKGISDSLLAGETKPTEPSAGWSNSSGVLVLLKHIPNKAKCQRERGIELDTTND